MIYNQTIELTTSTTDFFVVAQMSVDLVGFVNLVGIGTTEPDIPNLDLVTRGVVGGENVKRHMEIVIDVLSQGG